VLIHTLFDLLAACASMVMTVAVYRWRLRDAAERIENAGLGYVFALISGAALGGFGFGTLNLWISGDAGFARSIVGARHQRINRHHLCASLRNNYGDWALGLFSGRPRRQNVRHSNFASLGS
jgi:hypothetical protein